MKRILKVAAAAFGSVAASRAYQASQEEETKRGLLKKTLGPQTPKQFEGLKQIAEFHIDAALKGEDVKTYFTQDLATIDLAEKIISDHARKENFSARDKKSFHELILGAKDADANQKGSIPVLISAIEGSEFEAEYLQHLKNDGKKTMVCVGGPAAVDQALMASTIPEISAKTNVIYVGAGFGLSNLVNSALQVHARHGNALNADDSLSGHALLPILFARGIANFVVGGGLEATDAVENPDYRKVHVKFTLDPEKLGIYLGNEGNWLKQKFVKNILGQKNQHDLNREESVISAKIMHALQETLSEEVGREFKIIEGNKRENPISSSIHVALTQQEAEEARVENKHLAEINIGSAELTRERIEKLFGKNSKILAAFSYQGDGHVVPQYHTQAQQVVEDFGQEWQEPSCVKRIFLKHNEAGDAAIAGVVRESENGEQKFIPADALHFTGGYTARLVFDDPKVADKSTLPEALSSPTTVATGLSSNVILRRNDAVNNLISEFGNTGQLAVTNSHWTLLAKNDEHVILRMTAGGNTGSEKYNPNYFLNVLTNTGKIFEDEKGSPVVSVIRTYGCPRSINAINATSFEKLAEGFVVSYGKGGTGNTKRMSEAVIALAELGFEKEVVEYFNRDQSQKLGDEISKMISEFKKDQAFFCDSSELAGVKLAMNPAASVGSAQARQVGKVGKELEKKGSAAH